MSFIEYCTESENQNDCIGTGWLEECWLFIFMIEGLTGS